MTNSLLPMGDWSELFPIEDVEVMKPLGLKCRKKKTIGEDKENIIKKLATCGEQLNTYAELQQQVHWAIGHDTMTDKVNQWVIFLLGALS